jgi:hypothetical protein
MSSPDAALSWIYNFPTDDASSTCLGDSGGPIFLGNPRKTGDLLRIVAVTSRIQRAQSAADPATALCRNADVRAVNLATKEVAQALCSLAEGRLVFCKP